MPGSERAARADCRGHFVDSGLTCPGCCATFVRGGRQRRGADPLRKPDAMHRGGCAVLGFDIPNDFVVGYGLDYAEKYGTSIASRNSRRRCTRATRGEESLSRDREWSGTQSRRVLVHRGWSCTAVGVRYIGEKHPRPCISNAGAVVQRAYLTPTLARGWDASNAQFREDRAAFWSTEVGVVQPLSPVHR